jgi:hypothetical protein
LNLIAGEGATRDASRNLRGGAGSSGIPEGVGTAAMIAIIAGRVTTSAGCLRLIGAGTT